MSKAYDTVYKRHGIVSEDEGGSDPAISELKEGESRSDGFVRWVLFRTQ